MKKKLTIIFLITVIAAISGFFILAAADAEYESNNVRAELTAASDTDDHFYDRERVREYAESAVNELQNGTYRYLSTANGDSATNCANFVSQCLYAGRFEMTDQWYMRRYSDSVPYIKKLTDKVFTSAQRFISGSFDIGTANDYTDMDYRWSLTWSCAGDQLNYGMEHFFAERYDAASFEEFCNVVRTHDIKTGDVIYQSPENIHHVVIISDITNDGTVYIASHNPPLFDKELNEDFWKKGGFSGGAAVFKVKDQLT